MRAQAAVFLLGSILLSPFDSGAAEYLQFFDKSMTVSESDGAIDLAVWRTGTHPFEEGSVGYKILPGSATAEDIDVTPGRLFFGAGETVASVHIPILQDGKIEKTETFRVVLMEPSAGFVLGTISSVNIEITDDDGPPVSPGGGFSEGDGTPLITVEAGVDGSEPVDVEVSVIGGTATPALDYIADPPLTVHFDSFTRAAQVRAPFTILEDGEFEQDESIIVSLLNKQLQLSNTTTFVIHDDDLPPNCTTKMLYESGEPIQELLIARNDDGQEPRSVEVRISSGTAKAGADFEAPAVQTVQLSSGRGTVGIPIRIIDEGVEEPDETIRVTVIDHRLGSTRTSDVIIKDGERSVMLDPRFVPDLPPGVPAELVVRTDGRMILRSVLSSPGEPLRTNLLVQLNRDGSREPSFAAPLVPGEVGAMSLDSSGRLYLAGNFTLSGDATPRRAARLFPNGAVDHAFTGLPANNAIAASAVSIGDGLFVAGMNSTGTEIHLEHWLESGVLDPNFRPPVLTPLPGQPVSLAGIVALDSGKLLVGGVFQSAASDTVGLIRLNPDGGVDSTYQMPRFQAGIRVLNKSLGGDILAVPWAGLMISNIRSGMLRLNSAGEISSISPIPVRFYDQAAASGTNWVWASWTSVLNDHRCGVVLFSPTNIDSVGGLEFTDSTFIPFLVVPDERSALFARAYWKIGFHKALATRAGFRGVRFTRDSYSVAEGGLLDVVLERLGGTVDPLEVLLRTEEVSAKEGVDYRPITTPVVFNPGERTKHIQLAALDDAEVEGEETVRLRAEWNDSEGPQRTWVPVTIIDNDGLPEIRSIRITPNQVVLTSTSIPGYSYGVEVTTWLPGAAWTPTVLLPATTNVIDLAVPISDNTYDFYRVFRK